MTTHLRPGLPPNSGQWSCPPAPLENRRRRALGRLRAYRVRLAAIRQILERDTRSLTTVRLDLARLKTSQDSVLLRMHLSVLRLFVLIHGHVCSYAAIKRDRRSRRMHTKCCSGADLNTRCTLHRVANAAMTTMRINLRRSFATWMTRFRVPFRSKHESTFDIGEALPNNRG
jgi:hypothetical protein